VDPSPPSLSPNNGRGVGVPVSGGGGGKLTLPKAPPIKGGVSEVLRRWWSLLPLMGEDKGEGEKMTLTPILGEGRGYQCVLVGRLDSDL